jgi:hypothetical protein
MRTCSSLWRTGAKARVEEAEQSRGRQTRLHVVVTERAELNLLSGLERGESCRRDMTRTGQRESAVGRRPGRLQARRRAY